jgi:hypothetical protein
MDGQGLQSGYDSQISPSMLLCEWFLFWLFFCNFCNFIFIVFFILFYSLFLKSFLSYSFLSYLFVIFSYSLHREEWNYRVQSVANTAAFYHQIRSAWGTRERTRRLGSYFPPSWSVQWISNACGDCSFRIIMVYNEM